MSICRVLFVAGAMLLAGCADDSSRENGRPSRTGMEAVPMDTAQVDTARPVGGDQSPADSGTIDEADTTMWTIDAVDVDRSVPEIGVVDELRSGTHNLYDRLVVEFQRSVIPGYHVSYIDEQPIECGSGHQVDVVGSAVLEIRLQPARGHDDQGRSTVDYHERSYDMPVLREAEITCDFEAIFTIALGLDDRRPFRIMEFESPPRLVVDIRKTANE